MNEAKLERFLEAYAEKAELVNGVAFEAQSVLLALVRAVKEQAALETKLEKATGGASFADYAMVLSSSSPDELDVESVRNVARQSAATLRALKKLKFAHFAAWVSGAGDGTGDEALDDDDDETAG